jgi:predicted AlkP superfamily pyrophosphatase or phosphodiesterase
MKRTLAILFLLGVLIAPGLHGRADTSADSSSSQITHVILVSVDGLMPASYMQADEHGLKVPLFRKILREGAYSEGVQTVLPSVTYPAHTTVATGTNPGTHGIVSNGAWDPLNKNQAGWRWYAEDIRVPTLWDLARARGLGTALIWWPVTVGARAGVRIPEYWRASTPDDLKLWRALSSPGIFPEIERRYPHFCDECLPPTMADRPVADMATTVIENERPNLLLVHMPQVDHEEHDNGPFSPEADAAIENADAQIERLIASAKKAGTWEQTALVIVSDHGFAPITKQVRPGLLLVQNGLITLDEQKHIADWKAVVQTTGAFTYVYVKDKNDEATRETLLKIFPSIAGKADSGIGRVFTHEQIVAMGGDPDAFLALEAADGFTMAFGYTGEYIQPSKQKGAHGYAPDKPEMRASLLVYGPAIGHAKIANARLIDVAPTIARWLGLSLTKAEGKPLEIPLRRAARR